MVTRGVDDRPHGASRSEEAASLEQLLDQGGLLLLKIGDEVALLTDLLR